ncbi:MAG: PASTA domain-containing protein [Gammaproteobacteria bacterium]|nr:PASTA domain-containing protein [Gammaproteobacteria bacterium]
MKGPRRRRRKAARKRRAASRRRSPKRRRKERRRGRGRLRLLLLMVLAAGAGYYYATRVVFPVERASPGEFVAVPDLSGMVAEEALEVLAAAGLQEGAVDSISHPETPPGRILGQSPLPGQLALPGAALTLTYSLGPERRPVPDVTDLGVVQATALLEASGFQVAFDSVESAVRAGRIASTFPEGGVMLPIPASILVSVSLGPPLIAMPALAGLAEEEALVLLDSLGLTVGEVETRFRFGFNQGEVLEHFPPPDSLVAEGTEVRLVIGRRGFFPN